jgi:hypothetical protein
MVQRPPIALEPAMGLPLSTTVMSAMMIQAMMVEHVQWTAMVSRVVVL